jgi:hypothetical protein
MMGRIVSRCILAATALAVLAVTTPEVAWAGRVQAAAGDCSQPDECRDRALEARERGEYERFHDLAWRAVQTGRPNDPALMYLLARAQALSGRRRDAFLMLRRLADMGAATDAATEDDFRLTRQLSGWTDIEATFARNRDRGSSAAADVPRATATPRPAAIAKPPAPAPAAPPPARSAATPAADPPSAVAAPPRAEAGAAVAPPPPAAAPVPAPAVLGVETRESSDVARFSTDRFDPAGLAYDEVSRRFLFGDMRGRRLFVLGEGSTRTADLVRADAAGFFDVTALEIDPRRGDLWVTTTEADGSTGGIHRLQLISGRAIARFDSPADSGARLTDLAVAANGTVLVLDSAGRRVLRLRPGAKAVDAAMSFTVDGPASLAVADSDRVVYLAHGGGIVRLDLQSRSATPVSAPGGLVLSGFERIRWHRNSLVGVQTMSDASRALVRLQLNRAGTAITAAALLEPSIAAPSAGPLSLTVSGDDLYYSVMSPSSTADGARMDVLVRRVKLQ